MEAFKRWLANSTDAWLLLLDNADDPSIDVSRYFPPGGRGSVILTTRNPDCKIHATAGSTEVGKMGRDEAMSLLVRASGEEETDDGLRNRARPVVELLGYLALGIIHAGAVIRQGFYSFEEYCAAYKDRRKELLNLQPAQASSDYQYTVYTTWEISVNSIKTIATRSTDGTRTDLASVTAANALDLLTLFGFCHFDGIAEDFFQQVQEGFRQLAQDYPWWISNQLRMFRETSALEWNPLPFRQATKLLRSYSLIQMAGDSISLHPLVHSWVRDSLDDTMHLRSWKSSLSTLAMAATGSEMTYKCLSRLFPHVRSCLGHRKLDDLLTEDQAAPALASITDYLIFVYLVVGKEHECRTLAERALYYSTKMLGNDHELTCLLLNRNSMICNRLRLYQETIDIVESRENAVSTSLSRTAVRWKMSTMTQLAEAYRSLERVPASLVILERLLDEYTVTLGHDDERILDATMELSLQYFDIGRRDEAVRLFEDVFPRVRTSLGERTPHVLLWKSNLATMYMKIGREQEALKMQLETLEESRIVLGEDHVTTLMNQVKLAYTYDKMGQPGAGIPLVVEAIELGKASDSGSDDLKWMRRELHILRTHETERLSKQAEEEAEFPKSSIIVNEKQPKGLRRLLPMRQR